MCEVPLHGYNFDHQKFLVVGDGGGCVKTYFSVQLVKLNRFYTKTLHCNMITMYGLDPNT